METNYLLDNDGEPKISLCDYDKEKGCHCMTKSVLSSDKTHYTCGKCGATK